MNLSNRLTLMRLCLAPIFFCLFWWEQTMASPGISLWINLILILLATVSEISDAFDGRIARARGEVTDFGKLFDPFADSVTRFTFFLCFWWSNLLPAWMVVIIFYRDASISFLRLVVRGENVVLAARISGKIKAISQSIAIFMILTARVISYWYRDFPVTTFAWSVMLVVVCITVISFFDYITAHRHVLKQIEK